VLERKLKITHLNLAPRVSENDTDKVYIALL